VQVQRVRVSGAFTPAKTETLRFIVSEPHPVGYPSALTVNGALLSPAAPVGDWQFPEFEFRARAGEPVQFLIETKMKYPQFRVVRTLPPPVREVYLPLTVGGWHDFWTGKKFAGGETLTLTPALDEMPLFVRAGAIIPLGPELQYADEKPADPLEIRVYAGADGEYLLYEDEGDNYNYEKGAFAQIPIKWDDASRTLTIGAREGEFPGMLKQRVFKVVIVSANHGAGEQAAEQFDAQIAYDGATVSVSVPK
jgi:hypothetical protein